MDTDILTQTMQPVNFALFVVTDHTDYTQLPNGIYPFDPTFPGGDSDQWVVVIGGVAVNWARDYETACTQYTNALRVNREHIQAGNLPWDGSAPDEPLDFEDDELIFVSGPNWDEYEVVL